ncbi:YidH family protein [Nocardioides insulae]|uniref:YidH family protein n=1 Tax=Nocardioides insulae TaxID=394734 RepID=UPI0003FC8AA5|nr:DUF202 domain-containing protein [Nocardioides insulae]
MTTPPEEPPTQRPDAPAERRFPRFVFERGEEPDPRFSLANERTFLAWIRTGLALMAAAVALEAIDVPLATLPREIATVLLLALGVIATLNAWITWVQAERAMRTQTPLPGLGLGLIIVVGIIVTGAVIAAGILWR